MSKKLQRRDRDAVFAEQNLEGLQRGFPVMNLLPVARCLFDGQVQRLHRRLVVREDAAVAGQFPEAHVQALDRVGGVNYLADFRRELEERDDVVPVATPQAHHRPVFITPIGFERVQFRCGFVGVDRLVDTLQCRDDRRGVLRRHVAQAGTHKVHDTQLRQRLGKRRCHRFRQAFQAVHAGEVDVLHPALFQFG